MPERSSREPVKDRNTTYWKNSNVDVNHILLTRRKPIIHHVNTIAILFTSNWRRQWADPAVKGYDSGVCAH